MTVLEDLEMTTMSASMLGRKLGVKYFTIWNNFRTLFGYDRCSPQGDRSASGKTCFSPCQPNYESDHHHYQYQCYTDEMKEQLEDCGYWYVAGDKKDALEYTNKNQVRGCVGE